MKAEILVVDDTEGFAHQLALLIEAKTGLRTYHTSNPDDAQEFVRQNPVRVAVLDQRMPLMSGTELFTKIKTIDPAVRAIMLTGEASGAEVGRAMELGFGAYVEKGDLEKLPGRIQEQYLKAFVDEASKNTRAMGEVFYRGPRRYGFFGPRVLFLVKSVSVLDPVFIKDDEWNEIVTLSPGQEQEHTYATSARQTLTLEHQSQQVLKATLNLEAKLASSFKAGLEETLTYSERIAEQHERSTSYSVRHLYKLAMDTAGDPDAVISRTVECCATYRRLLIRVEMRCPHCAVHTELPILAFQTLPKMATRTVDTMRSGETKAYVHGVPK